MSEWLSRGLLMLLAILGHGFLWTGLVNRLHGLAWARPVQDVITKVFFILFLVLPPLLLSTHWGRYSELVSLDSSTPWGAYYALGCVAIAIASLLWKVFEETHRYDWSVLVDWQAEVSDLAESTEAPLQHGQYAKRLAKVPGNQATQLSVDRKRLALEGLPSGLAGLKIVHISDLHMLGRLGKAYYEGLAQRVNAVEPDVIALTGDILEKRDCWPWLETTLGSMQAKLGKYFVLGNHDFFVDTQRTVGDLQQMGWTYVGREVTRTQWNKVPVSIGGNELRWGAPPTQFGAKETGEFRLALVHTPDRFAWCVEVEADLALAGHTHGGQICFPLLGPVVSPSLYGTRYCCGVFRRGATVLHVTRGVAGKTPLRLNCPPELAVLELTTPHQKSE